MMTSDFDNASECRERLQSALDRATRAENNEADTAIKLKLAQLSLEKTTAELNEVTQKYEELQQVTDALANCSERFLSWAAIVRYNVGNPDAINADTDLTNLALVEWQKIKPQ